MTPHLEVHAPTAALARAVLRIQLDRLREHEPGARSGDEDAVHDMRVATRRLRAALRLFRDHLPRRRADHLRDELRWLATALGAVRDLDVMLALLDRWRGGLPADQHEGWDELWALAAAERNQARRRLVRALDSRRFAGLQEGLGQLIARPLRVRDQVRSATIAQTAPRLLRRRYARVRALAKVLHAPSVSAERLHVLRISCKQLRYALEFHAVAYGDQATAFVPVLVALQDVLGQHQDTVIAQRQLEALARRADPVPPALRAALAAATDRYRALAAGARRALPGLLRAARSGRWRQARRVFAAGR